MENMHNLKLGYKGLRDFSWFCLSGCALRDLLMQVENNTNSPVELNKQLLNKSVPLIKEKISGLWKPAT